MAETDGTRIVLMTAPDADAAESLVRTLVDERLVACGNVMPGLTSIYRWQGEVERDAEALVVLKTTADALPRLLERAAALHPYDVPELLAFPVSEGHGPYLEWITENVGRELNDED